jgi:hypothetical protein
MKYLRKHLYVGLYLSVLPFSLIAVALAWNWKIHGYLYYCSDPVPIIDFIPPFVHSRIESDFYIASPLVTYIVWFGFIFLALALPAATIYLMKSFFSRSSK